jgi:hypothetical protein
MSEIWKAIPEYQGLYEVSNFGNVKSIKNGKERKVKCTSDGKYLFVCLSKYGEVISRRVHQLVAMVFMDYTPDGTKRVSVEHINGIKSDNRLTNLRLTNRKQDITKERIVKERRPPMKKNLRVKSFINFCKHVYNLDIQTHYHLYERAINDKAQHSKIVLHVCEALSLDPVLVLSKWRKRYLVEARAIIVWNLRCMGITFKGIGEIIGRDHSTVIHCHDLYQTLLETDKHFRQKVELVNNYKKPHEQPTAQSI